MSDGPVDLYRPNVGVVLFHPDGRVWLGRRASTPGPHNWQFPQGGVDPRRGPARRRAPRAGRGDRRRLGQPPRPHRGLDRLRLPARATAAPRPRAAGRARSRSGSPSASTARTREFDLTAHRHAGVRRLALGRPRRGGRADRAVQARRLRAGGRPARLRRTSRQRALQAARWPTDRRLRSQARWTARHRHGARRLLRRLGFERVPRARSRRAGYRVPRARPARPRAGRAGRRGRRRLDERLRRRHRRPDARPRPSRRCCSAIPWAGWWRSWRRARAPRPRRWSCWRPRRPGASPARSLEEAVTAFGLYALGPFWLRRIEPDHGLMRSLQPRPAGQAPSARPSFARLRAGERPGAARDAELVARPLHDHPGPAHGHRRAGAGPVGERDLVHPPATVRQAAERLGGETPRPARHEPLAGRRTRLGDGRGGLPGLAGRPSGQRRPDRRRIMARQLLSGQRHDRGGQ